MVPVADVAGKRVTTIEGLSQGGTLHPVQQAFVGTGRSSAATARRAWSSPPWPCWSATRTHRRRRSAARWRRTSAAAARISASSRRCAPPPEAARGFVRGGPHALRRCLAEEFRDPGLPSASAATGDPPPRAGGPAPAGVTRRDSWPPSAPGSSSFSIGMTWQRPRRGRGNERRSTGTPSSASPPMGASPSSPARSSSVRASTPPWRKPSPRSWTCRSMPSKW